MRKAVVASILFMMSVLPFLSDPMAYARQWEPVKSERSDGRIVAREQDLEIKVSRGLITVNTNHPVQIKVFTILGQTVCSETVPAGISQLQVGAHGVYIIKTGEMTCKVVL